MYKLIIALVLFFGLNSSINAQSHLKKDGTPDKRYKENKQESSGSNSTYSNPNTGSQSSSPSYPTKKDGTPDMRYKENKQPQAPITHTKKDGTPDRRYKENK